MTDPSPPATPVGKMTTRMLLDRLQRHYIKPGQPFPGGIFVPECGWNGGGAGARCDALYVGFTSTSGRRLIGHELKVSRADWQHELDQSGKADPWHDQCHRWYVVAPSIEIVPPETLPDGWGLMIPSTRTITRMQTVVAARARDVEPSWDAVRSIMARQDTLRVQAISRAREKAYDDARADMLERERQRVELQAGLASAEAERVTKILAAARALDQSWSWRVMPIEAQAQALVDAARLAEINRDMHHQLEILSRRAAQLAEDAVDPLRRMASDLAQLATAEPTERGA